MPIKKIFLVLAIVVFGGGLYYSLQNREAISELFQSKDVTSLTSQGVPVPIVETDINQAISDYLPIKVLPAGRGKKTFCVHHLYGYEESVNGSVLAYVWAYCEEYYLQNGELLMNKGVSFPIKITLKTKEGRIIAQAHEEPADGYYYETSVEKMFPDRYSREALKGYDLNKFSPTPEQMADAYFK
jgi:hypothetical protein